MRLMRVKARHSDSRKNASMSASKSEPTKPSTATAIMPRRFETEMTNTIELDVRGLEAPEPLVRVLEALDALPTTDCLLLKIDCKPHPLFRILERNGYAYDVQRGSDALFEISIRKREPA